jgi:hypothetical protein
VLCCLTAAIFVEQHIQSMVAIYFYVFTIYSTVSAEGTVRPQLILFLYLC